MTAAGTAVAKNVMTEAGSKKRYFSIFMKDPGGGRTVF
jgi:hypothetical protein